jgi:hypothetical protein
LKKARRLNRQAGWRVVMVESRSRRAVLPVPRQAAPGKGVGKTAAQQQRHNQAAPDHPTRLRFWEDP